MTIWMQGEHIGPHIGLRGAVGSGGVQRDFVPVNVEEFWRSALLRFAHAHFLLRHQLSNVRGWIVQVPGDDGLFRAYHHASGFQADIQAVGTIMALGGS